MIIDVCQGESENIRKKIIIPFSRHEVSVVASKSLSNNRYDSEEVKVFEKETKKDVTKKVLGVDYSYSSNGYELMVILDMVFKFENN